MISIVTAPATAAALEAQREREAVQGPQARLNAAQEDAALTAAASVLVAARREEALGLPASPSNLPGTVLQQQPPLLAQTALSRRVSAGPRASSSPSSQPSSVGGKAEGPAGLSDASVEDLMRKVYKHDLLGEHPGVVVLLVLGWQHTLWPGGVRARARSRRGRGWAASLQMSECRDGYGLRGVQGFSGRRLGMGRGGVWGGGSRAGKGWEAYVGAGGGGRRSSPLKGGEARHWADHHHLHFSTTESRGAAGHGAGARPCISTGHPVVAVQQTGQGGSPVSPRVLCLCPLSGQALAACQSVSNCREQASGKEPLPCMC